MLLLPAHDKNISLSYISKTTRYLKVSYLFYLKILLCAKKVVILDFSFAQNTQMEPKQKKISFEYCTGYLTFANLTCLSLYPLFYSISVTSLDMI